MHPSLLTLFASEWEPEAPPPFSRVEIPPLENVDALYCVGMDPLVYEQVRPWLEERAHRRLLFLESRGPILSYFVQKQGQWLADPQVEVHWKPNLVQLARENPYARIAVIALPGLRAPRLALERHTLHAHALFVDRLQGATLWNHTLRNITAWPRSFLVNSMAGTYAHVPAIIVGAGPSLERDIPLLRQLQNRALIFAGGSAIRALSAHGIAPHFAVAIDPNPEEVTRLVTQFPTPLLYATRLHPDALAAWRGPLGYIHAGIGGIPELWCADRLHLNAPLLSLHPDSLTVTPVAVAIARHWGCPSITLVGVDLGYTGGRRYASGVQGPETREPALLRRRDVHGRPIDTALHWVTEARSLSATPNLRNASQGLAIPRVPYRPLDPQDFPYTFEPQPLPPPMDITGVETVVRECREGIQRIAMHLEVLAGCGEIGHKALAEDDLGREELFGPLFYELNEVLPQIQKITGREDRFSILLEIVRRYLIRDDVK